MTVILAIDSRYWISAIAVGLMIYYFTFLINIFKKLYERENLFTKIFLSYPKTPMYLATIMLVTVQILERSNANLDFEPAYTSVVLGFVVGIIAIVKNSNWLYKEL